MLPPENPLRVSSPTQYLCKIESSSCYDCVAIFCCPVCLVNDYGSIIFYMKLADVPINSGKWCSIYECLQS